MKRYLVISDGLTPYQTDRITVDDNLGEWCTLVIDTIKGRVMSAESDPIIFESWRDIEEFED